MTQEDVNEILRLNDLIGALVQENRHDIKRMIKGNALAGRRVRKRLRFVGINSKKLKDLSLKLRDYYDQAR